MLSATLSKEAREGRPVSAGASPLRHHTAREADEARQAAKEALAARRRQLESRVEGELLVQAEAAKTAKVGAQEEQEAGAAAGAGGSGEGAGAGAGAAGGEGSVPLGEAMGAAEEEEEEVPIVL